MTDKHVRRILREPEAASRTGYSAAHLCYLERRGMFPRRVRLQPGGAVGWFEDEIDAWLEERATARELVKPCPPEADRRTAENRGAAAGTPAAHAQSLPEWVANPVRGSETPARISHSGEPWSGLADGPAAHAPPIWRLKMNLPRRPGRGTKLDAERRDILHSRAPQTSALPPAQQAREACDIARAINASDKSLEPFEVGEEVDRLSNAVALLADVVAALVRECER